MIGEQSADCQIIINKFNAMIKEAGLLNDAEAHIKGCFGFCEKRPIVKIYPDNLLTKRLKDRTKCIFTKSTIIKAP